MKLRLLIWALAAPLLAQETIVPIQNWRVHAGDDPRWAQPEYDDSAWEVSTFPHRHTTTQPFFAGFRWYRGTATIPPDIIGHRDQPLG